MLAIPQIGSDLTRLLKISAQHPGTYIKLVCNGSVLYCGKVTDFEYQTGECDTVTILSTADIMVHGLIQNKKSSITAGFLALPNTLLGTTYVVDSYKPSGDKIHIRISAIENNTTVTFNCTNACEANTSFVLHSGESTTLTTEENDEALAGSTVSSDSPISVIVGSSRVRIVVEKDIPNPERGVLLEQLFPVSHWGYIHIVPPFHNAVGGWLIRVMAYMSNTSILLQNCDENGTNTLNLDRGEFHDINGTRVDLTCVITSDKVVQVMQYMASSEGDQYGDPSVVVIPPVRNYHNDITLFVDRDDQFIDITISQNGKDGVCINGSTLEDDWNCFDVVTNVSADSPHMPERYCYYFTTLEKGTHYITQDESETFLVRMYTHTRGSGAAMLANVGIHSGKNGI